MTLNLDEDVTYLREHFILSHKGMFHSIQRTRKRTSTLLQGDVSYAKRFFFIVLTDCICWLPLAVVKIIALTDMRVPGNYLTVKFFKFCL